MTPASAPDCGPTTLFGRVGAARAPATPSVAGDGPFAFDVAPALPAGLSLDPATGAISGTPTVSGPAATFHVTASNARASAATDVVVDVDPPLPPDVDDLA